LRDGKRGPCGAARREAATRGDRGRRPASIAAPRGRPAQDVQSAAAAAARASSKPGMMERKVREMR
jgi:hypothetical protein